MPGVSPARAVRVAVALLALSIAGCGSRIADSDQVLLNQFFAASRLRDLNAVSKVATVVFEPARDGIITSFDVTDVRPQGSGEDVSISAPVRMPDGRTVRKDFAVTIQGGLVTSISERPASPSPRQP